MISPHLIHALAKLTGAALKSWRSRGPREPAPDVGAHVAAKFAVQTAELLLRLGVARGVSESRFCEEAGRAAGFFSAVFEDLSGRPLPEPDARDAERILRAVFGEMKRRA